MTPRATTVTELEQMLEKVQHELDNLNASSIPQGSLLFWKVALETQIRDIDEPKSKIPSDFDEKGYYNYTPAAERAVAGEPAEFDRQTRTFRRILRPIPPQDRPTRSILDELFSVSEGLE